MKIERSYSLNKLKNAFMSLKEGVEQAKDELQKDGVIQRFEFTFELFWKTLKICLEDEGIICKTPKACLKAAFRIGVVEDENAFISMLNDRNKTSHLYSKEDSEKIFQNVKNLYLLKIERVLRKLEQGDVH